MSKLKELEMIFDQYGVELQTIADENPIDTPERKLAEQQLKGRYMAQIYFMLQEEKLNGVYFTAGTLAISGQQLNDDQLKALKPDLDALKAGLEGRGK